MSAHKCPKCDARLNLDSSLAGKLVSCGGCGVKIRLPHDLEEDSEPAPEVAPPAVQENEEFLIACPYCEVTLEASTADIGTEAPCPSCSVPFIVVNPYGDVVEEPAPVAVEEPAPVAVEEPAPVAVEEPEPVAVEEPEPIAVEEPEPVAVEEPEPIAVEEPAPVAVDEPEPVALEEPEPIAVEEPEPVEWDVPEPVKWEAPVAEEKPEPVEWEAPVAEEKPEPVEWEAPIAEEKPEPVEWEAPVAEEKPEPVEWEAPVPIAPEPVPAASSISAPPIDWEVLNPTTVPEIESIEQEKTEPILPVPSLSLNPPIVAPPVPSEAIQAPVAPVPAPTTPLALDPAPIPAAKLEPVPLNPEPVPVIPKTQPVALSAPAPVPVLKTEPVAVQSQPKPEPLPPSQPMDLPETPVTVSDILPLSEEEKALEAVTTQKKKMMAPILGTLVAIASLAGVFLYFGWHTKQRDKDTGDSFVMDDKSAIKTPIAPKSPTPTKVEPKPLPEPESIVIPDPPQPKPKINTGKRFVLDEPLESVTPLSKVESAETIMAKIRPELFQNPEPSETISLETTSTTQPETSQKQPTPIQELPYDPEPYYEAPKPGEPLMKNTAEIVDAYLRSPDWESRVPYSFMGERFMDTIGKYYKARPYSPLESYDLKLIEAVTDDGTDSGPYWIYQVYANEEPIYPVVIREENELLKVDWRTQVEFTDKHFDQFRGGAIPAPFSFRLLVEKVDRYPGPDSVAFTELKDYTCYKLTPPYGKNDFAEYAFVKSNSEIATKLSKRFKVGEKPIPSIVSLDRKAFAHGIRHMVITDLAEGWLD